MTPPELDPAAVDLFDEARARGEPIGVAISGGSDSTALLVLLADRYGTDALRAATVDHGLRPEAADEAAAVARVCADRRIAHHTLTWRGWDGQGNLQDAARRARYGLLAGWAPTAGVGLVALGHTRDDNAETLVMGLARGAGLDGLAGMRPNFRRGAIRFVRPLLTVPRDALRDYLAAQEVRWLDEPSNEDPRFERVRVRRALSELAGLGLTSGHLATSIANLRDTQAAIFEHLARWSAAHVTEDRGDLLIAPDALRDLPRDFARRLLIAALRWVSGTDHPPRGDKLLQAMSRLEAPGRFTLHGCTMTVGGEGLRIAREPEAATRAAPGSPGEVWDGRWRITGPGTGEVRALTEAGLAHCPDWRTAGLPRSSLAASPAVWDGDKLLAAPLAAAGSADWRAELAQGRDDFRGSLISR